jgi:hypothetical protein
VAGGLFVGTVIGGIFHCGSSSPLSLQRSYRAAFSNDQMRQEHFVGLIDGENHYKFWVYQEYQIDGWVKLLCPAGGARELLFAIGQIRHIGTSRRQSQSAGQRLERIGQARTN